MVPMACRVILCESFNRSLLIGFDKPRVLTHMSGENHCQPTFHATTHADSMALPRWRMILHQPMPTPALTIIKVATPSEKGRPEVSPF
jgi:hypothetical protein